TVKDHSTSPKANGCAETAKQFLKHNVHAQDWILALKHNVVPALLGLLLVSLPNLKALRCSALWIMDFPLLTSLISAKVTSVPINHSHILFTGRPSALFNFSSFEKLKNLSMSMEAIYYWDSRPRLPYPWPMPLLPPNIQTLQISEGTESTASFIEDLCKVKKEGTSFQSLCLIDVFFSLPYDFTVIAPACLRTVCSDAVVSLSLYFPGFPITTPEVDRNLWSLKEERVMVQIGWEKFSKENPVANEVTPYDWARLIAMESYGCEPSAEKDINFDAEGDIEMTSID
ncbi:hypothetical protein P171DRAFT_160178, partial [Karstenula rhodostoma CBS 690.94]